MIQEISNSANSILQQLAVVQFFVKLSMTTSDVISSSQEKDYEIEVQRSIKKKCHSSQIASSGLSFFSHLK